MKNCLFPLYKSEKPTKLTHTSCFLGLKGLVQSLAPNLGLQCLIRSPRPNLGLQDPSLASSVTFGPKDLSSTCKVSPRIRLDPVSISLSTFDKRRLRAIVWLGPKSPIHCILGPNPFKLGPVTCLPLSLFPIQPI